MSCKWNGSDRPRVVPGRHDEDCAGETCKGCLPCTSPHCRVCGVAHSEGTCPECMAETREALRDIARMCDALPEEVEHRGVEGEAMMLLGPACNPEARGHLEASVLAGRLSPDAIEASHVRGCEDPRCTGCAGELHPLFVLGSWDSVWREALEHDEPAGKINLAETVDYLDRQMTYMGGYEHVPFEDFARDLRRCVGHLESVLHDGEQVDQGAPCMTCGAALERTWGDSTDSDGWKCPKCKRASTDAQYRFAVWADHLNNAEWLSDADCAELLSNTEGAIQASAGTVRVWANKGKIRKRRHTGRTVYNREDLLRHAVTQPLAS